MHTLDEHLLSRGLDRSKYNVIVDYDKSVATFLLWNMSGCLVGYQQYNPNGDKTISNSINGKYYSYVGDEGDSTQIGGQRRAVKRIAVWGLESLSICDEYIFIVEGIFDAVKIHNAGYPCIAVLMNDPKKLQSFLFSLSSMIYIVSDNDQAGSKLEKFGDRIMSVPKPYKDIGEMPQQAVNQLLEEFLDSAY